ncbi:ammonium transporter [Novosphingobium aromaticivorans DSM 12444]|uniref:Ammonium transporter n=1 Tax=Novosphingobium aromaticivorans (strain ATCC 700278 / DSM 12444 / CCUG 56034 / CIP 105152 / NBRC 16084 / F199) TaxID=279238 RepID=Q2G5X7_NOVAD|nr:ammonium transporter [Novosphingobium aromaticivorans]ABD26746.1 ammonium transporter [Novosphingobium aromaticivorans DSM 12444]SCY40952.1 ammonium transporter [Novosphingobium aromaticivorans]
MRKYLATALAATVALLPVLAHAQTGAVSVEDVADTGDTAWILVSSAFVLMMAMPGLTLFYGGLVRAKGFLAVLVQVGAIAAVASVLWVAVGYTLAFGDVSGGWIGGGNAWMLLNLGNVRANTAIPESAFALFQMCFALITPALMVGAWVDRARFGWVVAFSALWSLIVYAPVAHWVWGGGWLATRFGTLDFAGGIVVHTTAGVSALVVAMLLGKRAGFPRTLMLPHSPSLTMAGAALLWVGWFGFNGGSALAANDDAASAIINTHVAACVAALVWLIIEKLSVGKPTSVGFATGAVAGLATVTPAAGFISPGAAMLFGAAAACVCYPMIQIVKQRLEIDDSLDVFAVHGVGGMIGSLLLAVFLAPSFGGTGYADGMNLARQAVAQFAGVGIVAAWSAFATVICALMVSMVIPMRVTEDEEREGLDITSHGERAWEFD